MHALSIFGTSSDAGKSTFSFALTYLAHQRGIKVAPFKAQNVSNNAQVCDTGGELAQAQFFAAESISLPTRSDFNPVLLKSGQGNSAALIINGTAVGQKDVHSYYKDIDTLKPIVINAFERLQEEFELIIAEGAGSPVELNLMEKDLFNITIAETFNTKIVLVADIERGGVFASIWGVYNLLPEKLKNNVIGVIINKFRGDMSLFDAGRRIIEKEFKLQVFGVVPYFPFNLGFEDMQSLENYTQTPNNNAIKVAVIRFPHLSNFTDFEPLVNDAEISLSFINTPHNLEAYDLIILPGTKRTVADLKWLHKQGFAKALAHYKGRIVAICGGYEMMFEQIHDPEGVEEEKGSTTDGLGYFKGEVIFSNKKRVKKGSYELFNHTVVGYEIHNGMSQYLGLHKDRLYGTFLHGLFDNNAFRTKLFQALSQHYKGYDFQAFKKNKIAVFASHIENCVDVDAIFTCLKN